MQETDELRRKSFASETEMRKEHVPQKRTEDDRSVSRRSINSNRMQSRSGSETVSEKLLRTIDYDSKHSGRRSKKSWMTAGLRKMRTSEKRRTKKDANGIDCRSNNWKNNSVSVK